jgi:hypothetical protein
VKLINGGTEVQIDFTGSFASDAPTAYTLQSAGVVEGPYADVTATITSLGSGNFRAVRAVAGDIQFYKIKR